MHRLMYCIDFQYNIIVHWYITFSTGQWSDEGLTTVIEKNSVVCKSTHLTSFAVLVDVSGSTNVSFVPIL